MSMLDSFFNKGFKAAKCKTLLKLTIPRIKLLRNRRELQIKQMRRDIAKLLETGQEATARIRVEHIIREENMMAAQEILELFSELISVRLPIIETQRECPLDLKEAISTICFAAPRCADLPELLQAQMLFAAKYGKEFVSAATELRPDCGVNRQVIELLSIRAPAPDVKLKLLKEIAEEHGLDWDPAASESEFLKPHEDLLNGPTQFVSASKLPLPEEKHNEVLNYGVDQVNNDQHDSDSDTLDFPEVPKVSLRPTTNVASAPVQMLDFPEIDFESSRHSGANETVSKLPHVDSEVVAPERSVESKEETSNDSVGPKEHKQFLPFISSPSLPGVSSPSLPAAPALARQTESPPPAVLRPKIEANVEPAVSRTKSDVNVDLQDVLAAAQAAADSAERAAAAARSAASLAQIRIAELTQKKNDEVTDDGSSENPFHAKVPDQLPTSENPKFDNQYSFSSQDEVLYSPNAHLSHEHHQEPGFSPDHSFDKLNLDFDSPTSVDHAIEEHSVRHQPQRLPSLDDEPYFAYPNLFTSQSGNHGSGSFTDNSPSHTTHS